MSTVQDLVLGGGAVRSKVGLFAAAVSLVGLVNRFSEAKTAGERVDIVLEGVKTVTDLTPSQSDDVLVAKVEKYVTTPEAIALLAAGLAYWESIKPKAA
jgi:hypothetical protein